MHCDARPASAIQLTLLPADVFVVEFPRDSAAAQHRLNDVIPSLRIPPSLSIPSNGCDDDYVLQENDGLERMTSRPVGRSGQHDGRPGHRQLETVTTTLPRQQLLDDVCTSDT